ncbi:MAG: hypothetical protein ACJAUP_002884 [Cellvibrionaceae bacterium]
MIEHILKYLKQKAANTNPHSAAGTNTTSGWLIRLLTLVSPQKNKSIRRYCEAAQTPDHREV